jgi:hypothetical protein
VALSRNKGTYLDLLYALEKSDENLTVVVERNDAFHRMLFSLVPDGLGLH